MVALGLGGSRGTPRFYGGGGAGDPPDPEGTIGDQLTRAG